MTALAGRATAIPYYGSRARYSEKLSSGKATTGMVCGVVGLLLLFVPILWLAAIVPSGLGIIFASVAFGRIRRDEESGWGMAVTGLLTGIIGTLLYGILWLIFQDAVREAFSLAQ